MGSLRPEQIPPQIVAMCQRLQEAGHQAYLVGGAVRDHLHLPAGQAGAKDFDITTSALPEEVIRLFGRRSTIPTGIQHGTVTVLLPRAGGGGREHVEVTTFRGEGAYSDGRRPDQVAFHQDLVEDLRRRDFTINAIAYDPVADRLEDPFGGQQDLQRRLLRAVGDPTARFGEDGLRAMRAVRLAAQLEFDLDPATAAAIPGALPTLRKVSWERIRDELLKLLGTRRPSLGLDLMAHTGLLREVLPELPEAAACFPAVDALPREPLLRLAALLWPLGEAGVAPDAPGRVHAVERLRLSGRERDRVLALLALPPIPYTSTWSDAQVRRFLAATPVPLRDDLFQVARAQARAAGCEEAFDGPGGLGSLERRCAAELLLRPPLTIGALALSGGDLIRLLGMAPGPRVGEMLRQLLAQVLDDPARNTPEELARRARALLGGMGETVAGRDDSGGNLV